MIKSKAVLQSERKTPRNPCGISTRFRTRIPHLKNSPNSVFYSCEIIEFGEGGMKLRFNEPVVNRGEVLVVDVPVFGRECTIPYPAQVRWVRLDDSGGFDAGLRFWAWG